MTAFHSLTLETFHQSIGAKFALFAGYWMPIQYPLGVKGRLSIPWASKVSISTLVTLSVCLMFRTWANC